MFMEIDILDFQYLNIKHLMHSSSSVSSEPCSQSSPLLIDFPSTYAKKKSVTAMLM